jgi:hypothetical protein
MGRDACGLADEIARYAGRALRWWHMDACDARRVSALQLHGSRRRVHALTCRAACVRDILARKRGETHVSGQVVSHTMLLAHCGGMQMRVARGEGGGGGRAGGRNKPETYLHASVALSVLEWGGRRGVFERPRL